MKKKDYILELLHQLGNSIKMISGGLYSINSEYTIMFCSIKKVNYIKVGFDNDVLYTYDNFINILKKNLREIKIKKIINDNEK